MDVLHTVQGYVRRRLIAAGARSQLYEISGHRVHAYRMPGTGQGPPVVLVHGLAGTANGFARILVPLSRRFSAVYALDLPGNGFSPLPASGPLTLPQTLDVLHAFCREVVKRPAFVVGNSLGGALALMLAGAHPGDVAALGLLAPAGAQLTSEEFAEMMERLDIQTVGDALRLTRRLFHKAPLVALLFAPEMKKLHATPAVRAIRGMLRPDDHVPSQLLGSLRAPLLLLWGGSEKLLLPQMLSWFRAHLPPAARIEVVKGFGHVPQMERPREVVARLTRFADEARL
jgi:pimeloyl-ACP methyl ester carboxylesterase